MSSNHPLIQHDSHYIRGYMTTSVSLDMFRITRVVDTGSEGEFDWLVNNRKYRVKKGDFMLFNNTDLRMPIIKNKPSDILIEIIRFSPIALFNGTELLDIYYNTNRTHYIPSELADSLIPSFERTAMECKKGDKYSEDAASAALKLLLVDIARLLPQTKTAETKPRDSTTLSHMHLLNNIVKYMSEHMSEVIRISDVTEHFGISESLLSKLFRSMLEMSFPEYLRRLRVNNVIALISNGKLGIIDAALESGFTSVSGFYKSFQAITGTSPREFISNKKC